MSRSPEYLLARIDLLEQLVDQIMKALPLNAEGVNALNQISAQYMEFRKKIESDHPDDAPRIALLKPH